ncbi:MAG: LD-carboxypeptidase [Bacteroidia bacterium]
MNPIIPPFLKQGDKVAIAATARKVSQEEMKPFIDFLQSQGFNVVLSSNIYNSYHQFAGTDYERTKGLQTLLDDETIKAVFFARGGYGTVRIIDLLNFDKLNQNPKWLVGFSDITVLHSHVLKNSNMATMHAPMAINYQKVTEQIFKNIIHNLKGNFLSYSVQQNPYNKNTQNVSGILTGGNLSVLYSVLGSKSDINTDDMVLFIEDLDEYLYHIDRMMQALKRAGKLKKLKALLVGGFTQMRDNTIPFGFTPEEIILQTIAEYNYPVFFDIPAGHIENNNPLIFGKQIHIKTTHQYIEIMQ